jgi:hypothetical protein
VLKPDSEFFRYFVDPTGNSNNSPARQMPTPPAAPATPR